MPASPSPFLPATAHYLIGAAALFLLIEFLRSLPILSVIKRLASTRGGSPVFARCLGNQVRTAAAGLALLALFYVSGLTPIAGTPPSARWLLGGFAVLTALTGLMFRARVRAEVTQIRRMAAED